MKKVVFVIGIIFLTFSMTVVERAQALLDGFDPNANGPIYAIVLQPDGKIIIGGDFTTLAPNGGAVVVRNRIARLNENGSLDTGFDPNANGTVNTIALQSDGRILAGGSFTTIGGLPRNRIARLDAATGLADSFDPNASNAVYTIVVQADGKILAGGFFSGASSIGGQTRNFIARLDATTGLADSFDPNAGNQVNTIVVQPDGKILAGGTFAFIGGQGRSRIARLDATTGAADSWNPNSNGGVYALAIQANGKIFAGGGFSSIGGQARNRIARLDAVTGLADSLNPNVTGIGPTVNVYSIVIQPDGFVLVGGDFGNLGGQARNYIGRIDPLTGLADSFNPVVGGVLFPAVYSIAVQPDEKVVAGGEFATVSPNGGASSTRNNIFRYNLPYVRVTAPIMSVLTGSSFDVPISVSDTTGGNITAYDFEIQYDPAVLALQTPSFSQVGTLCSSSLWIVTPNTATPGLLIISAFNTQPLSGAGTLLKLRFTAVGVSGTTSTLVWPPDTFAFYTTSNVTTNGLITVTGPTATATPTPADTPSVSGVVTYGNAAAPPKYISNVAVLGNGSPTVFTTTSAPGPTAGQYTLTGFGAGSYTVSLTKTTGVNGINSFDAARVAQHVAGTGPGSFTTNAQRISADVTNNGVINSFDAAKIAQYAAGLPLQAPNLSGTWRFFVPNPTFPLGASPTSRTYSSVTSNITGDDYIGILGGEVTGNWAPSAARTTTDDGTVKLF